MKPTYPLYPQVLISTDKDRMFGESKFALLGFATTIRKEHEGKHYFWDYKQTQTVEPQHKQKALIPFLTTCYMEVYKIMQISIVQVGMINGNSMNPHPQYRPDDNTDTERARLIKTYHLKM